MLKFNNYRISSAKSFRDLKPGDYVWINGKQVMVKQMIRDTRELRSYIISPTIPVYGINQHYLTFTRSYNINMTAFSFPYRFLGTKSGFILSRNQELCVSLEKPRPETVMKNLIAACGNLYKSDPLRYIMDDLVNRLDNNYVYEKTGIEKID